MPLRRSMQSETAAPQEAPVGWDSGGQCMCTRRFRSSVVEAEYLAWHFGIWGRRTRWFAAFATAIVLANLALVLAGGSTRRAALDLDGSPAALGCLIIAPVLGTVGSALSLLLFSRTKLYNVETHQGATVAFIIAACAIDAVPRIIYSESIELHSCGLCNITQMGDFELASLAASDATSFAYAQCLILGTVVALAGLRPAGCTVVAVVFSYIGHRDQNAMNALCFGTASPMPSFATRVSALAGSCALSFALNERFRCEFTLQQMVRVVTVERVRQEQEARDWARKLEEKRASQASRGGPPPPQPALKESDGVMLSGSERSMPEFPELGALDARGPAAEQLTQTAVAAAGAERSFKSVEGSDLSSTSQMSDADAPSDGAAPRACAGWGAAPASLSGSDVSSTSQMSEAQSGSSEANAELAAIDDNADHKGAKMLWFFPVKGNRPNPRRGRGAREAERPAQTMGVIAEGASETADPASASHV